MRLRSKMYVCFVLLGFIRSWMTCSLPTKAKAQRQDLHLTKQLINYKPISPVTPKATAKTFSNYMWYLSEKMLALEFSD